MLMVNQLIGFGAGGSGGLQYVGGAMTTKAQDLSASSTMPLNSGLTGGIASAAASGDLVIASFSAGDDTDLTLSITDGANPYTLIADLYSDDTVATNLRVAYKFITADTETTFGPSIGGSAVTAVNVFRGVNVSSPFDVTTQTATGANSGLPNPPSITPVTAGAIILVIGAGGGDQETPVALTYASSDLSNFVSQRGIVDLMQASLGIGLKEDWISGAFDPAAFTAVLGTNSISLSWAAVTMALRPA